MVSSSIRSRPLEFGGELPFFCKPIVPCDFTELRAEAETADSLKPELIEWRADFLSSPTTCSVIEAARLLRTIAASEAIIFTLRKKSEGGVQEIANDERHIFIATVVRSQLIDLDLELANELQFLDSLMAIARDHDIPVRLAFHNFENTPLNEELLVKIEAMRAQGAHIATIAVMPRTRDEVLRLLQGTATARKLYPELPLVTMSMGGLGTVTRIAGFLYGSDMSFASGKTGSAPGQIPIEDARSMSEMLLRYS
jgi:3-dehydroquinate dehydratase-1